MALVFNESLSMPNSIVSRDKRAFQVKRAAELLDVSVSTLWRWHRKGLIRIETVGKVGLVPVTEIDRLLDGSRAA